MATLDFTPLFRSSIGFDRLPGLLSDAIGREESPYPPYNIEKCGEDRYRIVLALAGFTRDDVEIVLEHNRLFVRGKMKDRNGSTYLHLASPAGHSSGISILPTSSRSWAPPWGTACWSSISMPARL
jgi:HSP20 family molecular chaperone IbpA